MVKRPVFGDPCYQRMTRAAPKWRPECDKPRVAKKPAPATNTAPTGGTPASPKAAPASPKAAPASPMAAPVSPMAAPASPMASAPAGASKP